MPNQQKGFAILPLIIIIALVLGFGFFFLQKSSDKPQTSAPQAEKSEQVKQEKFEWKEGGMAIVGKFADADIVDLGDGKFRMYYSIQPEVSGNKLEVYSSTSTDGKNWTKELGVRKTFSTFPDVVKLKDDSFRMYFQNSGVIKSAKSADGLTWTDEPGIRIDTAENGGLKLENVAATTTTILPDGTYLMVYRGHINERYPEKTPNNYMQLLLYATSLDGLTFDKKGIALDSRTNKTLMGLTDGPEFVKWDNGQLRLYFWSYSGVYHVVYENGKFSTDPLFDYTVKDPNAPPPPLLGGPNFPPNPPGDPTIAKIGQTYFMYYGQPSGIHFATLAE